MSKFLNRLIAEHVANSIYAERDNGKINRIALKSGNRQEGERDHGGLCRDAFVYRVAVALDSFDIAPPLTGSASQEGEK